MVIDNPSSYFAPPTAGELKALLYNDMTNPWTDDQGYLWLWLNGDTIARSNSNAIISNSKFERIYSILWYISGIVIAPSRGSNATADWTANKLLTLPDARGRAMVGAGQGGGLTLRSPAATFGTELHTLTLAQTPAHTHSSGAGALFAAPGSAGSFTVSTIAGVQHRLVNATDSQGGGQAHNNMQPSIAAFWMIATGVSV